MGGVGREARVVTDLKDRGRAPIVDVGGREIAQATVVMRVVVPREEIVADRARVFDGTEAVRNWASEKGLSLLTRGREWLASMPRSENKSATSLLRIGAPRSA